MEDERKITMILPKDIEVKSYLECSKHDGFSASYTVEGKDGTNADHDR